MFGIGVLSFLCTFVPVFAQSPAAASFEKFLAEFQAAVARNDARFVVELTQLPFLFDSKPRDGAGFQKIYPQLFGAKARACFATANAVIEQDAHVVNCGRYIFYFRVVNGRYRLIKFAADPEATL